MKEDIFLKANFSTTYMEEVKEKWTSKLFKKIFKHKIIFVMIAIITICSGMNFWLIYSFINLLEA